MTSTESLAAEGESWGLTDLLWDPELMDVTSLGGSSGTDPLAPLPALKQKAANKRGRPRGRCAEVTSLCMVEACAAAHAGATAWERRTHCCSAHATAERFLLSSDATADCDCGCGGAPAAPHRFCQKCCRAHLVTAFAGAQRSCAASLARHNSRRRAQKCAARAAAAPAPVLFEPAADEPLAPGPAGEPPAVAALEAWLEQLGSERGWEGGPSLDSLLPPEALSAEAYSYAPPPTAFPALQLKLPCAPAAPPPGALAAAASAALGHPDALCAALQPGCSLLTLRCCLVGEEGGAGKRRAPCAADALAAAMAASPFLRSLRWLQLSSAEGGYAAAGAPPAGGAAPALPPPAVRAGPRALQLPAPEAPLLLRLAPGQAGRTLRAEFHGRWLRAADGGGACSFALHGGEVGLAAPDAEGVLLLVVDACVAAPPAVILLCRCGLITAEVAADAGEGAEEAARLLGLLLHARAPPPSLAFAAAATALRRGWRAAFERSLGALAAALAEAGDAAEAREPPGAASLLHIAAACGALWAAPALAAAAEAGGAAARWAGQPHSACGGPAAASPLHAAAAALPADAAGAAALRRLTASAEAAVAWHLLRCGRGLTPAELALARPGGAAAFLRLHDAARRRLAAGARAAAAALAVCARERAPAAAAAELLTAAPPAPQLASADADARAVAAALLRHAAAAEAGARLTRAEAPPFPPVQLLAYTALHSVWDVTVRLRLAMPPRADDKDLFLRTVFAPGRFALVSPSWMLLPHTCLALLLLAAAAPRSRLARMLARSRGPLLVAHWAAQYVGAHAAAAHELLRSAPQLQLQRAMLPLNLFATATAGAAPMELRALAPLMLLRAALVCCGWPSLQLEGVMAARSGVSLATQGLANMALTLFILALRLWLRRRLRRRA